jgi:hypothetical protein
MKIRKNRVAGLLASLALTMSLGIGHVAAENPYPEPTLNSGIPVRLCIDNLPYGNCDTVLAQTTTATIYYPGINLTLPGAFQLDLTGRNFSNTKRYVLDYGTISVAPGSQNTGYGYGGIWENGPFSYVHTSAYGATINTAGGSIASYPINAKDFRFIGASPISFNETNVVIDLGAGASAISGLSEVGGQIWGQQY